MGKYCYEKTIDEDYVIHHEEKVESGIDVTIIAICDSAEKADFICKACNQFSLEQYEAENEQTI